MSEARNCQPKAFLKKGTRQFLSNATVRSLNQKPRIVQFGEDAEEERQVGSFTSKPRDEDIVIKVKPKPPTRQSKQIEQKVSQKAQSDLRKAKQNKNVNEQKGASIHQNVKKRASVLEDYLGGAKKEVPRNNQSKEKSEPEKLVIKNETKLSTMTGMLKRQDEDLESDQDSENSKPVIKPGRVSTHNSRSIKSEAKPLAVSQKKVQKKFDDSDEEKEQINFNSDSEEDVGKKKGKDQGRLSKPDPLKQKAQIKNNWKEENDQQYESKVLKKYYKRQTQVARPDLKNGNHPSKLKIQDIPAELKQQIIQQCIADKQQNFKKKLAELEAIINSKKKLEEKAQEQNRKLQRQKEAFKKEIEQKNKQFEERVKNQTGKLNREKKYMKDQQTSGKADWRVKNEVEDLRAKFQQSENEKKKIKLEMARQIERLRKKLQQETNQKESLKAQIRCIQMEKMRQKQIKDIRQIKENHKSDALVKVNYWVDVPTRSYVSNFFDDNFTLISFDPSYYCFQSIQYYQYYLSKKDQISDLILEESDGNKISRKYKNGKQEQQYISKVLRQTFPFKFSIVHHFNGDVKLTLPEGMQVYYDSKNQVTEFKITPSKIIHNFHRLGQIQLKFNHNRLGNIHELYKGDILVRKNGQNQERFRKEKGAIIKI